MFIFLQVSNLFSGKKTYLNLNMRITVPLGILRIHKSLFDSNIILLRFNEHTPVLFVNNNYEIEQFNMRTI